RPARRGGGRPPADARGRRPALGRQAHAAAAAPPRHRRRHEPASSRAPLPPPLAPEAAPTPLLLVGPYRHPDLSPDHPLTPVLADLRREPGVQRIGLSGLGETQVGALME